MKKTFKMIGVAAILAAMIPIGAYAAESTPQTNADEKPAKTFVHHFTGPWHGFAHNGFIGQDVLDLLKLDQSTLKQKLAEGKSLAEIAEEQGVSRDALKQALTDSFNKRMEELKAKFAENVDKLIDSTPQADGFMFRFDLNEAAKLLGVSNADLKEAFAAGKSLADVAQEKGVDVQALIDTLAKPSIDKIEQQLQAGNITQEKADKLKAEIVERITKLVNAKGLPAKFKLELQHFKKGDAPGKPMIRFKKGGYPEQSTQTQL